MYCTEKDVRVLMTIGNDELTDPELTSLISASQSDIDSGLATMYDVPFDNIAVLVDTNHPGYLMIDQFRRIHPVLKPLFKADVCCFHQDSFRDHFVFLPATGLICHLCDFVSSLYLASSASYVSKPTMSCNFLKSIRLGTGFPWLRHARACCMAPMAALRRVNA